MEAQAFVDPVLLGSGDDLAELEGATAVLQHAGLAVCVIDDSTPWIRIVDTIRSSLGFATVRVVEGRASAPERGLGAPSGRAARSDVPELREPRNPIWMRMAILGGALLLPMALTMLASTVLGDAMYDDEAPAAASAGRGLPGQANGHGRRISMHAGAGRGDPAALDERAPQGRGGAGAAAPEAGGQADSIELTADPDAEAPATPPATEGTRSRRTARRAIAAIVMAFVGALTAALLGEAVERWTRSRSARFRRRLRMGLAAVAGLGVLVAPVVAWQANASARAAAAAATGSQPERPIEAPRPPGSARPGSDPRCAGGPFARYLCRSHRPSAPVGARGPTFASLLAGYRQRSASTADAGPPVVAEASVDGGAHRRSGRHARRDHHRRHHEPEPVMQTAQTAPAADAAPTAPAAPAAPDPSAGLAEVDAALPVEATAEPETMAVAAPAAPAAEPTEAPVLDEPEAPHEPIAQAPRRRPLAKGWLGGWFVAGLALGLLGAPGWRRLGRSET